MRLLAGMINFDWNITGQLILFFRLVLASLCGGIIGIERQQRIKVAGTRTHIMVSLAAALMMIISKYGFMDVLSVAGTSWDVSRVAAGVITGIGILGGIIVIGKQGSVSGTTTAAGLLVTIAVGMAFGAGMYAMGIGTTLLVRLLQYLLHRNIWIVRQSIRATVRFRIEHGKDNYERLMKELEKDEISVHQIKWDRIDTDCFSISCQVLIPTRYKKEEIVSIFSNIPETEEFEIIYM